MEAGAVDVESLKKYDVVIFGGGLYAGTINGASFVKEHYHDWNNTVVFLLGASPASLETFIDSVKDSYFTAEQQCEIKIFYFQGNMDYQTMKPSHRKILNGLKVSVEAEDESKWSQLEKGLMMTFGQAMVNNDKARIGPLIEYVKGLK